MTATPFHAYYTARILDRKTYEAINYALKCSDIAIFLMLGKSAKNGINSVMTKTHVQPQADYNKTVFTILPKSAKSV